MSVTTKAVFGKRRFQRQRGRLTPRVADWRYVQGQRLGLEKVRVVQASLRRQVRAVADAYRWAALPACESRILTLTNRGSSV